MKIPKKEVFMGFGPFIYPFPTPGGGSTYLWYPSTHTWIEGSIFPQICGRGQFFAKKWYFWTKIFKIVFVAKWPNFLIYSPKMAKIFHRKRTFQNSWKLKISDQLPGGFPLIEAHPTLKSVEQGRTAHVTCRVEGDPRPKVLWLRDLMPIDIRSNPRYSVSTLGNPGNFNFFGNFSLD
jgi:hypothetical protein